MLHGRRGAGSKTSDFSDFSDFLEYRNAPDSGQNKLAPQKRCPAIS
jgi:hypothetical protein